VAGHKQLACTSAAAATAAAFAKTLGKSVKAGEPRATHRRSHRPYKTRVRMPSKLDPHIAAIEGWLADQPQLTALAIVGRLREKYPEEFGARQHSIVQRLLRALRRKAAEQIACSGSARRNDDRRSIARGCGRLGLCRAAPLVEQAGKATWRGRPLEIETAAMGPSG
jgi:hypothetical protein